MLQRNRGMGQKRKSVRGGGGKGREGKVRSVVPSRLVSSRLVCSCFLGFNYYYRGWIQMRMWYGGYFLPTCLFRRSSTSIALHCTALHSSGYAGQTDIHAAMQPATSQSYQQLSSKPAQPEQPAKLRNILLKNCSLLQGQAVTAVWAFADKSQLENMIPKTVYWWKRDTA